MTACKLSFSSARPSRIVKSNRMYFILVVLWSAWSAVLGVAYYFLFGQLSGLTNLLILCCNYVAMVFFLFFALWHYLVMMFRPQSTGFERVVDMDETKTPCPQRPMESVAVLYTTCDDFNETAAETCLALNYPDYRLFILDDSKSHEYKKRVEAFCQKHALRTTLVRRKSSDGFKAGNLNYAIENHMENFGYILIADADERLPAGILRQLLKGFDSGDNILFVQSGHICTNPNITPFGRDFHGIINYMWCCYQHYRNKYGLMPSLGHGVLLNLEKLKEVGGFPPIVSEDIALTLKARLHGYVGYFIPIYEAGESFPESYKVYRKRFFRWTIADCECFHRFIIPFLFRGGVTIAEKMDIFIREIKMESSALILPLLLVNTLMSPQLAELLFSRWETHITLFAVAFSPFLCFIFPPPPQRLRKLMVNIRLMIRALPLYLSFLALPPAALVNYIIHRKVHFTVTGSNRVSHAAWQPNSSTSLLVDLLLGFALSILGISRGDWITVALILPLMVAPLFSLFRWGSPIVGSVSLLLPLLLFLAVTMSLIFGLPAQGMFGLLGFSVLLFS